jgi:lysozyme
MGDPDRQGAPVSDPRRPAFDGVRQSCAPKNPFNDPGCVHALHNLLDAFGAPRETTEDCRALTEPMVLEILEHESIVREAYRDSKGVWTWAVGITSRSGHRVERYKDNPQSIERCIAVYVWLLRTAYLPAVLRAFGGFPLAEHELAAALSFHWNTGAIARASWVASVKAGNRVAARAQIMEWTKDKSLIGRRKAERNLFFDRIWTQDGIVTVWPVKKPAYTPDWAHPEPMDVRNEVRAAMLEVA